MIVRSESGPSVSIPLWIVKHPGLNDASKIFWAILKAEYADRRRGGPSRADLAADLNLSLDSVDRHYRSLAKAGAVRIVANTGDRATERGPKEIQLVESENSRTVAATGAAELRPSQRVMALVEAEPRRTYLRKTAAGSVSTSVVVSTVVRTVRFAEFWSMYPRTRAKADAQAWWLKHGVEENTELWGTILAGLKRWIVIWEREAKGRQFIPYPATWLRKAQYLDDDDDLKLDAPDVSRQTQGMISASHRFMKRHGK